MKYSLKLNKRDNNSNNKKIMRSKNKKKTKTYKNKNDYIGLRYYNDLSLILKIFIKKLILIY